jgi:hypothetical protein
MSCAEHRDSQILIALMRRLEQEDMDAEERRKVKEEISRLENRLGLS